MRPARMALTLGMITVLAGACGKAAPPTAPPTAATSSVRTPTIVVDRGATPPGWVPVAYGDIQVSVPATWDIDLGCPLATGNVYLGPVPKLYCPSEPPGLDIVVLGADTSPPPAGATATVINHITVDMVGPDDTSMVIPVLHASVSASGPLAGAVLHTVTYSPRAVALATGTSPAVPAHWRRLSFGGLSAAVPRSWGIDRRPDVPVHCAPIDVSLPEPGVVLTTGTVESVRACPAMSSQAVSVPTDGLVVDPGPDGPLPAHASFGPCSPVHGLRVCSTSSDRDSILVVGVLVPGRIRPIAVEIGLAGSGVTARTILGSLRAT